MQTFTEIVAAVVVSSSAAAYSHFGVTLDAQKVEKPVTAERTVARTISPKTPANPAPRAEPSEVFSTQFGHEITLIGEVPVCDPGTYEGLSIRWANGAFLGIDAPRETSRARKALRRQLNAG